MLIAHLNDGTPVRVMRTPLPVIEQELTGRREGDIVVGYTMPSFSPYRLRKVVRHVLQVRRGADGNLWLVHLRKGVEC